MKRKLASVRGWLGSISIRARVLSLSVVAMLGIGLIAGGYTWGQQQTRDATETAESYSELAAYSRSVAAKAGALQSIQNSYQLNPSASLKEKFFQELEVAFSALSYLRSLTVAEQYALEVDDAKDTFEGIKGAFNQLYALQEQVGFDGDSGLRAVLSNKFNLAQNELAKNTRRTKDPNELKLISSLSEVKQQELAFQLTHSDVNLGDFEVAFSRFERNIGRVDLNPAAIKIIDGNMKFYRQAFDAYTDLIKQQDSASTLLTNLFDLLPPRLEALQVAAIQGAESATIQRNEIAGQVQIVSFTLIGIIAALSLIIGLLITRSIMQPLSQLRKAMVKLAKGETTVIVEEDKGGRELASMAQAVTFFRQSLIERKDLEVARDRESASRTARAQNIDQLIAEFETSIGRALKGLDGAAEGLSSASQDVEKSANNVLNEAGDAGRAVEEATVNVSSASSATEELAMSINEIASQTDQTSRVAGRAMEGSKSTTLTMHSLSEAADHIGDAVNLIREIANQTNLLALNATIEAARAGEHGKGFAVVAAEVKQLANQTSQATEEIALQVGSIQEASANAVEAIGDVGNVIEEMNQIASAVAASVEQQNAAVSSISENVANANQSALRGAEAMKTVAQASQASRASGDTVSSLATVLSDEAGHIRSEVTAFLQKVRAA
ncbi:methyl-accepting chemotaxis protein [Flexibacterium corallicola]|uniref:methyl-accepting chemotaxis protein n=1 Tax=Flexibacterium corallicola TaxID=3037259 RepID=UPI00286F6569|nr:methyl-accepting chemotaxis protein [Pseudovibrio sp. M1P-2-3]